MIEMNTASKKKSQLITYAQETLHLPLTGHETVAISRRSASSRSTMWPQPAARIQWVSAAMQPCPTRS